MRVALFTLLTAVLLAAPAAAEDRLDRAAKGWGRRRCTSTLSCSSCSRSATSS